MNGEREFHKEVERTVRARWGFLIARADPTSMARGVVSIKLQQAGNQR